MASDEFAEQFLPPTSPIVDDITSLEGLPSNTHTNTIGPEFHLDEERGCNFSECFVLKAQTRLRRGLRRQKDEAMRLGVRKVSLVEMTDDSPVGIRLTFLELIELVTRFA